MADEYIRKQDAIDEINTNADDLEQNGGIPYAQGARAMAIVIEQISSADVAPVEILKAEIYKLKCQQNSKNQDYYTGYMSALSTVEGILPRWMERSERNPTEPQEIGYDQCANAMLKMWMDNVVSDAEYNRIIDRLNKLYFSGGERKE